MNRNMWKYKKYDYLIYTLILSLLLIGGYWIMHSLTEKPIDIKDVMKNYNCKAVGSFQIALISEGDRSIYTCEKDLIIILPSDNHDSVKETNR